MLLIVLAAVSTLATHSPSPIPSCSNGTTVQIDACLAREAGSAEDDLTRYRNAALDRLRSRRGVSPGGNQVAATPQAFDAAEKAWDAYREAECDAVFDNWSDGTIRAAMETNCDIQLTRLHTHTIWRNWLTFIDSTPPVLPEPPVSADPS